MLKRIQLKESKPARIGIYTVALKHYWGQFEGLRQRMIDYGQFISNKISTFDHTEVFNYGLVDTPEEGNKAGHWFSEKEVDIIFVHCGTCVTPEISNAFNRADISYRVINGLLGLENTPAISITDEKTSHRPEAIKAWREIKEWVQAASVFSGLKNSRFGFLGNTYSGMLEFTKKQKLGTVPNFSRTVPRFIFLKNLLQ